MSKRFTFISADEAREDLVFYYEGKSSKCTYCDYRKVCHNIQPKRAYRIVQVKDKTVNCKAFSKKMRLVDIRLAEIRIAIDPKMRIEGATIKFNPQICGEIQCERFDECVPSTINPMEKCKIVGSVKKFSCPKTGKSLVVVFVLPQQVS